MKNLSVHSDKILKLNKMQIHSLVKSLKEELNFSINNLAIIFVNSSYIHALNKKYLEHNSTTDIITFNYSGENDNLDGEIYISYNDAELNANKYKVTFRNEILRLIIHGVLHMLGYDDQSQKEKRIMKKIENMLVAQHENSFNNIVVNYDG